MPMSPVVTAFCWSILDPGGTDDVSQMLPPIIESCPTVMRPSIEELE